jgi:hypothetical protein
VGREGAAATVRISSDWLCEPFRRRAIERGYVLTSIAHSCPTFSTRSRWRLLARVHAIARLAEPSSIGASMQRDEDRNTAPFRRLCRGRVTLLLTVTGLCRGVPGKRRGKHRKWLIDMVLSRVLSVS